MTLTHPHPQRVTVLAPRLEQLLQNHLGQDLFRLEADTIGVGGPDLADALLASRPARADERPTFKPIFGRRITKHESAAGMRALGQDVRAALRDAPAADLSGRWPQTGHRYLRDLVFGEDPFLLRMLTGRGMHLLPHMTWTSFGAAVAALPEPAVQREISHLAVMATGKAGYRERRHAMVLYRRLAAPVCLLISTMITSALWLGAPFDDDVPDEHILHETLRLLPPSWNLLRRASPEYPAIDGRIGPGDDLLFLNFLSQRDPALWDEPEVFRPERWNSLDPESHPGYLPFGHVGERCWGRHLVMPLALMVLSRLREGGYTVDAGQRRARVPLDGLMGVSRVMVVRARPQ
ncbi:cytochrome P450 [Kineosporia sp. J2-2]|uniref:Cytochrome P450 n=1 Tax=Kineosporia corallincola TaxID=2835133 RepID=A0ABS5TAQ4_9ACTN|nr:cytochrome P450 [Kineosporia corallincola]MBT0768155.1 cytochrome P450 [Kineosporia corallincola]